MKKYLQNKVAESKLAWPVTIVYATVVWLLAGLVNELWWTQFVCFVLSTLLMAHLNSVNALIRIYSRMVTCSFLLFACCSCFLFPSLQANFLQLCVVASILLLFHSYQDKEGAAWLYYAFLCIGLGSLAFPLFIYFIPLLLLLTATHIQALSWRTLIAALLGFITPYWVVVCWFFWKNDFSVLTDHFTQLTNLHFTEDILSIGAPRQWSFIFLCTMTMTGMIHFLRNRTKDKIRTRQLYGFFIWVSLFTILCILLQPQYFDQLLPILIITASPLTGHFLALTSTKITNIAFFVIVAAALLITAYNLWNISSLFS